MQESSSLFTFAVVADAHIRLDTRSEAGDYPSNQLANGRNRHVIQQINQLAPNLVIHLGDFVHPIPALPTFEPTMQIAHDMYQHLDPNLHVLPGNHDIGDKPNARTPAPAVSEAYHMIFERLWGPTWSSFDHKGCHFVLINTPILNSGLPREAAQRAWLERDLAANQAAGNRVFMFLHYPLYLADPQESTHYDNIDQPARAWLLALLAQYQVEAVFAGHVHNFFYNRYHDTDLYVLPSTAFIRPGFSELFAIEPAAEYGRNDPDKLGFCLVTVEQDSYHIQTIRTRGATDGPPLVPSGRQGGSAYNNVGVYLRQAWAEPSALSIGNLDEFGRKRVRNDYLLWGLWDLGIRRLRVPFDDLADAATRQRMGALQALGHQFTVFTVGVPDAQTERTIRQHQALIATWELILTQAHIPAGFHRLQAIKQSISIPVYLSQLETLADQPQEEGAVQIDHFAKHGFRLAKMDAALVDDTIDGVVFRLEADTRPWEGIHRANQLAQAMTVNAVVHVQLPKASEGRLYDQDVDIANRVAETAVTAAALPHTTIFLEPFVDFDRGYHPRHGLLDKRYNPRPAYEVWRHLHRVMSDGRSSFQASKLTTSVGVDAFPLETAFGQCVLLLSRGKMVPEELDIAWKTSMATLEGMGQWLDLYTGQTYSVHWQQITANLRIIRPKVPTPFYPALFSFDSDGGF